MEMHSEEKSKFSIRPGCIRKIPLNPPLQKGEAVGMRGLIDMLRKRQITDRFGKHFDIGVLDLI
jgi:hypothetical protein